MLKCATIKRGERYRFFHAETLHSFNLCAHSSKSSRNEDESPVVRRTMFKMRIGSTWCRTDQYLRSTVAEGTRENVKESGQGCGKKKRGRLEGKPMERTILVIVAIMDGQTRGHEIETVAGKTWFMVLLYLRKSRVTSQTLHKNPI